LKDHKESARRNLEATQTLATVLAVLPAISKVGTAQEPGAWIVAYALADIVDTCSRLTAHVESLKSHSLTPEAVHTAVVEIGEDLRHILYQVQASRYYDYLLPVLGPADPSPL
jgi:hypothetical protein